jgi:tetratricopeptide (TPR) repeat protein
MAQLIEQRVALSSGAGDRPALHSAGRLPAAFVEAITARAEGNPFYVEELLRYLDDRGIAPGDVSALERLELPGSLASLILSRIDQLSAEQQTVLKVASVVGRSFRFDWLWGVHPALGAVERVRLDLEVLARLDITPLDSPAPDLSYLFKHATIQEVAYASMPYARLAQLHEQLAGWLEARSDEIASLDLLAYHYGRSLNGIKQRMYFKKAGDAAAARYANATAIQYYERLLGLLAPAEQGPALIALARLMALTSAWESAEDRYRAALDLAAGIDDSQLRAQAELGLGMMKRTLGRYREAQSWLARAELGFSTIDDRPGLIDTLAELAFVYLFQAQAERAQGLVLRGMALAQSEGDRRLIARALHMLGNVASFKGDQDTACDYWRQSMAIRRVLGDKPGLADLAQNLAVEAFEAGRYEEAQTLIGECLDLCREVGARRAYAQARLLLPLIMTMRGEAASALAMQAETLALVRDLQAMQQIADGLVLLAWQTQHVDAGAAASRFAVRLAAAASKLQAAIGSQMIDFVQKRVNGIESEARERLGQAEVAAARAQGAAMGWQAAVAHALEQVSGARPEASE